MLLLADQGRAMFQLLDANRDNRLSPRELLSAWDRLAPLGRKDAEAVNASDIARQFQINVQQGQVDARFGPVVVFPGGAERPAIRFPLGKGKAVPEWFRRMDKSGDGEVSTREFLGTQADFQRIDTDRDGMINADEAILYDEQVRGRKY
jgi:Ca2+-binding EF-hand superfamily protein